MAEVNSFEKEPAAMFDEDIQLPSSPAEARELAFGMVGLVKPAVFARSISRWWDRLIAAQTPEEKLGCQLMIDALGYARGLHDHKRGSELAKKNKDFSAAQRETSNRQALLSRWE